MRRRKCDPVNRKLKTIVLAGRMHNRLGRAGRAVGPEPHCLLFLDLLSFSNVVNSLAVPQLTYLEAIRQGIWEEMERDPTVFCLGEDIGIYGGAFKITDGFIDSFGPERVIDTPIAESAIVGAAFGASLTGLRPVAEFQFMDFIVCAFNQITN